MDILREFDQYVTAELWADEYRGDTGTDRPVRVVEDFDMESTGKRFLVVIGPVSTDFRYEVQYVA